MSLTKKNALHQLAASTEVTPTFDLASGLDWGSELVLGPEKVVTYYFYGEGESVELGFTPGTDHELDELDDDDGVEVFVLNAWSDFEKQRMLSAFDVISQVVDLKFVEVERVEDANFHLGVADSEYLDTILGLFMAPEYSSHPGLGLFNQEGRGWDLADSGTGLYPGGYGFITLIHEVGHGLGLAHPHDSAGTSLVFPSRQEMGDAFVPLDQGVYTMMSYNDGWVLGPDGVSSSMGEGWLLGPMALDIYVLQRKYGANLTHEIGDSVYLLSDENAPGTGYLGLWDAGGYDTIRYEGERDVVINLNAATLQYEEGGGGMLSYASGVYGGYSIAYGVIIESAESGAGNDILIGNAYDNDFRPGTGNDYVNGGAGHDTVFLASSAEGAEITRVAELLHVQTDEGLTRLFDIERVAFSDRTLALDVDGVIGQTEFLYWAILGRSSDASGLAYWVMQQESAPSTDALWMATNLIVSEEYGSRFASESDSEFVARVYQDLLQREADSGGQTFWEETLSQGVSRAEVAVAIVASDETQQQLPALMETGLWLA